RFSSSGCPCFGNCAPAGTGVRRRLDLRRTSLRANGGIPCTPFGPGPISASPNTHRQGSRGCGPGPCDIGRQARSCRLRALLSCISSPWYVGSAHLSEDVPLSQGRAASRTRSTLHVDVGLPPSRGGFPSCHCWPADRRASSWPHRSSAPPWSFLLLPDR